MSSLSTTEHAMFSRTYTERLLAVITKNATIPNKRSTSIVLMHEVMNCISKNVPLFLLMLFFSENINH